MRPALARRQSPIAVPNASGNRLIDLLTGADLRDTGKNPLVQKVLRQLIETYGFDRNDKRYRLPADFVERDRG